MITSILFFWADPSRLASHIAKAACVALLPHLGKLREEDLTPLAVRVCLDPENVKMSLFFIL
jgi:hypothetical protein